ncbi:MAG TPA: 5'/3'-nucleotidase SurE [Candidatus Ratteibacteria bacterium]|nr:5'/3'-nucleotidase SurE [bacterium]HRR96264.1 5'/3'-nucleotidase SurE [Candidatus Ratteibacteria bacterium]
MKVLITNDDGIYSKGLKILVECLPSSIEKIIVVPEFETSAISHAINLFNPIRIKKIDLFYSNCYIVNGTPVDCVKIGVKEILKNRPDVIISGVNLGPNLGMDILYSGTVAAAAEGAILGIPSIAISITDYKNFDFLSIKKVLKKIIKSLIKIKLPEDTIFNINIPNLPLETIKGIKFTFQSKSRFIEEYEKRIDPKGVPYFWLKGNFKIKGEKGSDVDAIKSGFISITPLNLILTDDKFLKELKKLYKNFT